MSKHSSELKAVLVLSAVDTLYAEAGKCSERMLHRIISEYQCAFRASMFSFHPRKHRMVSDDLKSELGSCFRYGFLKWQHLVGGNRSSIVVTATGLRFAWGFPVISMAFRAGLKAVLLTGDGQSV